MANEVVELDQRAVRNHLLRRVRFELPKNGQTTTEEIIQLKLAAQGEAIPAIGDTVERLAALYGMGMDGVRLPQIPKQQKRLAELVHLAVYADQPVKLVAPTCPDYGHRFDPQTQREVYTFEKLGTGVGITGERLLDVVPALLSHMTELDIPVVGQVLIADVEADDPEILQSVHLRRAQFLARCHQTRRKIAAQLPSNFTAGMMSKFLESDDYERAEKLSDQVNPQHIVAIGVDRADLYRRWFKRYMGNFHDLVVRRATEDVKKSLTFGSAVRRQGAMVIEATDPQLASHYMKGDDLPVAPLIMIENSY